MAKNLANLRFAVADNIHGHSNVWRLWVTKKEDIYLSTRSMAGILKLSFHVSGECRYAFTKEHADASAISQRLLHRWMRPSVTGKSNSFARLCWLAFPTNYLSKLDAQFLNSAKTFPAAAPPGTTFVEMGITHHTLDETLKLGGDAVSWGLILWLNLQNNQNLFVRWYHGEEEFGDIRMPASHGLPGYRFVYPEAEHPERPIRFHMMNHPVDHDAMCIEERGGCLDN